MNHEAIVIGAAIHLKAIGVEMTAARWTGERWELETSAGSRARSGRCAASSRPTTRSAASGC